MIAQVPHQTTSDGQYDRKSSNDADSCSTLRAGVHRIYLPLPVDTRRRPRCKLGYHCVFNHILWVLYTGMQWKCLPVPRTVDGKAGIHYTTIYKAFAKWCDDCSLEQAFIASVRHLAAHRHLDLSILHGDGT